MQHYYEKKKLNNMKVNYVVKVILAVMKQLKQL